MNTKAFTFWNSSALLSLSIFLCLFPPFNPVWSPTVSEAEAGQEFTTAPQVGLKLTIFLPQSPEYRHDRHKPRYLSLEPRGLLRWCEGSHDCVHSRQTPGHWATSGLCSSSLAVNNALPKDLLIKWKCESRFFSRLCLHPWNLVS